eukprot:20433-Amphidinium_carterae.1
MPLVYSIKVTAKQAARRGAKSALIEEHLAGGDCLNFGCVPSKVTSNAPTSMPRSLPLELPTHPPQ